MSRLYDRSRTVTDWVCPRKRYWNYEFAGKGIVPNTTALELFLGTTVHDGLAAIAHGVAIDDIAAAAWKETYNGIMEWDSQSSSEDATQFALEQAALVEGLLRGFRRHVWPQLMAEYPTIMAIEKEMQFNHNGLTFMSKPDLVLEGPDGPVYVEYKTTSSKKDSWINSWNTAVQLHSTMRAIRETLNVEPVGVVVQGLYKGYECLSPETPILTADLRWVAVGNLQIGERIAGFEAEPTKTRGGRNKKRQWAEALVTHTGRQVLPSYKLVLEDGTDFVCSENHLWLTCRDNAGTGSATWTATKDLSSGCYLIKVADMWKQEEDYGAGYLAAAFDGEGNISQHETKTGYWLSHLAFTQKANEMLKTVKTFLREYGFSYGENERRGAEKIGGIYIHGQAQLLSFLGSIRPKRLLPKFSFDKLGGMTVLGKPLAIRSLEFLGDREVVTLGTSTETLVAKGIATHNSYGKQSSPFCYAYRRAGNPPFTKDEISYEYRAGFKRFPIWELPGGVAEWVARMPDEVLRDQFPRTPLIFINEALVDAFFAQRTTREMEIAMAMEMIKDAQTENDAEAVQQLLDTAFPQRFDQCIPTFGRPCIYRNLCFNRVADPLAQGYTFREPHHAPEMETIDGHNGS